MIEIQGSRLKATFEMSDVLVHIIVWTILSIVTIGIGLVFWPYASAKLILNAVDVVDAQGVRVGRLRCDLSGGTQVAHAILWYVLILITFGVAWPFYVFAFARQALDKTSITSV